MKGRRASRTLQRLDESRDFLLLDNPPRKVRSEDGKITDELLKMSDSDYVLLCRLSDPLDVIINYLVGEHF